MLLSDTHYDDDFSKSKIIFKKLCTNVLHTNQEDRSMLQMQGACMEMGADKTVIGLRQA